MQKAPSLAAGGGGKILGSDFSSSLHSSMDVGFTTYAKWLKKAPNADDRGQKERCGGMQISCVCSIFRDRTLSWLRQMAEKYSRLPPLFPNSSQLIQELARKISGV